MSLSKREAALHARKRAKARLINECASLSPNQIAANLRAASDGFLHSPEWKALRAQALERYGRICCRCGASPKRPTDINVDHIKPRKFFPELALDIENLQPLCRHCNKRKGNGPAVDYRRGPLRRLDAGYLGLAAGPAADALAVGEVDHSAR